MAPKNTHRKNPKNTNSELFKKLTRLFSGPIVDYRSQSVRRYRRSQLDKFSKTFKSLSGQQFKRSSYHPFQNLQANMISNQNRSERYADFDQMEYTPEIASALDIYADEMTTSSDLQPLLTIVCPNEEIKTILNSLYHNVMNIEYNLFGWCRSMCKYGDFFLYIDIDSDEGIKNIIGLPTQEVERIEGEDKTNPNYVQYQWNSAGMTFENWQVAHFRVLGNDKNVPYGTSSLEAARRIWRQLTLLEDAMMAYRIVRSPERRVFYVDTGNIPAHEIEQYMQKVMTSMKRNQLVDETTGRVDLRYNPLSVEEDYYIPVRGGTSTRVESLPGGTFTGDIEDVQYLRDKLFSALKVPQSYLSRGQGAEEDKTTLAQKDVRFARTIQRLQRVVVSELEKIAVVHLYTLGYRGNDLVSFKLKLNNPSKIAELQELESWRTKFDTANAATEGFFSRRWVAEHLFNMSEEEFLRNQRELFYDRKVQTALDAVVEEQMQPTGGPELGGDPGELAAGEEFPPEGELPPEEEMSPEEEAGEEGVLLATPEEEAPPAPGKRDDYAGGYTTPGSKGKVYYPVKDDRRNMGARRRHLMRKATPEYSTSRKVFPGIADLFSLTNGIAENKRPNYRDEEYELLKVDKQLKDLITDLEKQENEVETQ